MGDLLAAGAGGTPDPERAVVRGYPFGLEGSLDIGSGHALRQVQGGDLLWWHDGCTARGWCSIDVTSGTKHRIVSGSFEAGDLTIRESLLCRDCGAHGYVNVGRWAPV